MSLGYTIRCGEVIQHVLIIQSTETLHLQYRKPITAELVLVNEPILRQLFGNASEYNFFFKPGVVLFLMTTGSTTLILTFSL